MIKRYRRATESLMLNRILQTLFLCIAALILTSGLALSSPLPNRLLIAEHTPDHDAVPPMETVQPNVQTVPSSQPPRSPQTETPGATPDDRHARSSATQPIQANPSVPYDPYDYDAIRKMNRGIYGEGRE